MNNQSFSSSVVLDDRKKLRIDGVSELSEFDEFSVTLNTVLGKAVINGTGLNIVCLDLDKGIVEIDGTINEIYYTDIEKTDKKSGFIGRLFR